MSTCLYLSFSSTFQFISFSIHSLFLPFTFFRAVLILSMFEWKINRGSWIPAGNFDVKMCVFMRLWMYMFSLWCFEFITFIFKSTLNGHHQVIVVTFLRFFLHCRVLWINILRRVLMSFCRYLFWKEYWILIKLVFLKAIKFFHNISWMKLYLFN